MLLLNGPMDDFHTQFGIITAPIFGKYKQLSVILNSPGGSATATYKMILALRRYVDDIEVLVPRQAKSAATFFCLGADTVYMGTEGELGPLDPQVLDRTGSVRQVSALETFKGLEQLLDHSLEAFDTIVKLLLVRTHLDVPIALKHTEPLFAAIVSSLYQNVDLHELGESRRYLAEIEEYAVRVMTRWSYKNEDADKVQQIVRRLVWEYPSHGFVIDLEEAQEIGLNAKPLSFGSEEISKRILDSEDSYPLVGFPDTPNNRRNAPDYKIPTAEERESEEDGNETEG